MNRNFKPPKPTGDGTFIRFCQSVWDRVFGPEGQFISTTTVRVEHTTRGIKLHAAPQIGGGSTPSSGGMIYRGIWTATPTSNYMTQDVVLVQGSGPSAGTYVSIMDNNPYQPDTGIGWVQIAPGDTIGRWS